MKVQTGHAVPGIGNSPRSPYSRSYSPADQRITPREHGDDALAHDDGRAGRWGRLLRRFLALFEPRCEGCGARDDLDWLNRGMFRADLCLCRNCKQRILAFLRAN